MASLSDTDELLVPDEHDESEQTQGCLITYSNQHDLEEPHGLESAPNSADSNMYRRNSYISAVLLMFALSSMGIALAVVPIMIPTDEVFMASLRTSGLIVRSIYGVAVITICVGFIYMRFKSTDIFASEDHEPTLSESGRWLQGARTPRSLTTKYMLITLFLFGIGTILSCVLYIVQYSITENIPAVVDNILYITILCFQLTFFYYYEGEVLSNRSVFHYTIAIMIGIEVWVWVGETLWPLWIIDWSTNETDIHTNTTHFDILEFSIGFLEPFYVEFATIAVSILFHLWHKISKDRDNPEERSYEGNSIRRRRQPLSLEYPNTESLPSNEHYEPQSPSLSLSSNTSFGDVHASTHRKLMIISVLVATFLGLNYVILCEPHLNQIIFSYYVEVFFYRSLKVVYFTALSALCGVVLFKLRHVQIHDRSLNSSEYVLLLGTCSDSIYYIFRIVASIGYLTLESASENAMERRVAVLCLFYSAVAMIQIWIQSRLFLVIRRKQIPHYVKYVLVFISAINFAEWFQRGLHLGLSKHGESQTVTSPIMEQFFGETSTRIMRLLLLPVMILYRFHSGLVAVELIHEH